MMGRNTNAGFIAQRALAKLADTGLSCAVVLNWNTKAGGTYDPISQSTYGATLTPQTATVRAFIHYINAGHYVVRDYAEVEAGDCIADFAPAVAIDGKDGLTFTIDGVKWSQKPMSDQLARHWDTLIGDTRILRSVLLRKL